MPDEPYTWAVPSGDHKGHSRTVLGYATKTTGTVKCSCGVVETGIRLPKGAHL